MKTRNDILIDVQEWDKLVEKTYRRPYKFQQQDGCQSRGLFYMDVPGTEEECDYKNDTIPEVVNGEEKGVSFEAWLARDPKQKLSDPGSQESYCLKLWWYRNFYPNIQIVADDLHRRGLLKAGQYAINIDW